MLSLMLALFLSLPSLACAGDSYNDELRLLDLELEILSLKSQMLSQQRSAIDAESREATRARAQRNMEVERDMPGATVHHPCSNWTTSPCSTLSRSSPLCAPMPEEQRARMWCVVNDCWLNQAQ
jgi:hypothetical protein